MTHTLQGSTRRPATTSQVSSNSGLGPLVKNAWYVIAERAEVGRELRQITVLGEPMVIFRAEDGTPVVLDDRCAHRRYSLAASHLEGDTIRCGYHGFTYDKSGACIFAPGVSGDIRFGVRKYDAAERGPWLWAWMGDADTADLDLLPFPEDQPGETWDGAHGYTFNECNYLLVHENLLDLTHLHYLHGPQVADVTYATTPPTALKTDDPRAVGHGKDLTCEHGPAAMWAGTDPSAIIRRVETVWSLGPSFHRADQKFLQHDGTPAVPGRMRVLHAITPQDEMTTHQFWGIEIDAPVVFQYDERVAQAQHIFHQDVEALTIQNRYVATDRRRGVVTENSIPSDVHGVKFRRVLQRLAKEESEG
ncbi:Rieske 2Fe-2S domain-containing protein [Nocardia sp. NPDC051911]|uniref:Rieske 2Fe-2S domain-containing protein n=1 Tax=Nocardia sp. NPDC051911 TaxID=3154648 RepID=UPI00341BD545